MKIQHKAHGAKVRVVVIIDYCIACFQIISTPTPMEGHWKLHRVGLEGWGGGAVI